MSFRPDNPRTNRAHQTEECACSLVQDIFDREKRVRNNLASTDVDPWTMRFVADESIFEGAIITWHNEAAHARRPMCRYDIQRDYREKLREVEKHIDTMLHLVEPLEESWDAAAHASKRLSDAETRNVAAFEHERERRNDAAETKRQREGEIRRSRRKAESIAVDAWDAGHNTLGKLLPLSSSSKDIAARFRSQGSEGEPREIRWATARDLRKRPPLPEDQYSSDLVT